MQKQIELHRDDPDALIDIYDCISYLADKNQLENLVEIHNSVKPLVEHLDMIGNILKDNDHAKIKKIRIEYFDLDDLFSHDKMITGETFNFNNNNKHRHISLSEILYRLRRLCTVNSSFKSIIYTAINSFKIIISKANLIEKLFCLKLLSQLCFNNDIAQGVSNDTELIKEIKDLSKSSKNLYIQRVCAVVLCSINNYNFKGKAKTDETKMYDVMISFNIFQSKASVDIKNELEKNGFTVWMDISNEEKLDDKLKAITSSSCVLMCICERYKLSEKCQIEARYASRLKKPLIPVIVQKGSDNLDGWIDEIITNRESESNQDSIDFTKFDFDICFKNLKMKLSDWFRTEHVANSLS